ncbi:MAG: tetratricopeptide repeat protein, partial [Kiritimatiellae bacterium]|nr:tetratricopeptide repeat protein [Kiritimatiellia bacterium]
MFHPPAKIRHTCPAAAALGAALLGAVLAAPAASAESVLPIPPEATDLQRIRNAEVVAEARKTDVSVTEENALLYHGLQLEQDEEWEEAMPFLEEALRRDPSLQSGWEGLGWCYVKTGDIARARDLWEYFRRLMPQETLPHSLLAQAAIIDRDWAAADVHFRDAIATGGASYDVRFWYAQNLMRLGRPEQAEEMMRVLVAENPDRLDIQLDLASLLNQRLAYEEAVEIYRRVNDELPGNPRFMLEQALLETRVGELDRADALCLDVLEIDPENVQAMTLRADISEIAGQQDIGPFLGIIDETTDAKVRARLRIRLANRCHLANTRRPGQYEEDFVLGLMRDAIKDDPETIDYKILYAERLLQAGLFGDCKQWAVQVLEKDNRHHARAKMILFELAMRERRFEDALQILVDRYGAFDSTDPMQHYNRARLMTAQGDFPGAMREIDLLEAAAAKGCVFTLAYEGLTESDWTPATSVRRLHEHIMSLQREGWTLVSPADIPSLVGLAPGERRGAPAAEPDVPGTARFFDWIRWAITGQRRFAPRRDDPAALPKPVKCFAVTFEGDHRSALILGTPVAHDFGVPFGLFTQTEPSEQYVPSRAGWQELRDAAASGAWVVGTQLHGSYLDRPADAEGERLVHPLVNRIWIPEKNRRESMNEWDRRMRAEFRTSAEILHSEMGTNDCPVTMVAYPYGDIGQSGPCNLSVLRNPAQSILSEAAREYQVGFVPSDGGFTVTGDNLLLCRRWDPPWSAEGADVVRHAYESHPAFLARRMRVELAMLMNKPNLAVRTLDLLRRDGYPEDLCRALERGLQTRFRNKPLHDVKPLLAASGSSPESEDAASAAETAPAAGSAAA